MTTLVTGNLIIDPSLLGKRVYYKDLSSGIATVKGIYLDIENKIRFILENEKNGEVFTMRICEVYFNIPKKYKSGIKE